MAFFAFCAFFAFYDSGLFLVLNSGEYYFRDSPLIQKFSKIRLLGVRPKPVVNLIRTLHG
ncbi:MAG: hypothetical protein B6D45_07530 [Ignavibacteriales bacterium UTCHB3]|nr:MAG: hypothetical protein B6D45_07530 [Ignavibacteriales bacterium UTCHB3]